MPYFASVVGMYCLKESLPLNEIILVNREVLRGLIGFMDILQDSQKNWANLKNMIFMGPGKPGKSFNFIMAFSRTCKSWKKATGPGKFWKSVKPH